MTFGELEKQSNQWAQWFLQQGLKPGDRLGAYLPNSLEFILLFLACIKLGVIVVPINLLYKEREIARIISDAEPRAVVATEPISCTVPVWSPAMIRTEAASLSAERVSRNLEGEIPAAKIYTSGTTGAPKGAVLTQQNFAANARVLCSSWQIDSRDRLLLCLPLFHVHGLGNGLHCWLFSGCRLRLWKKFDRLQAERVLLDFRPTLFFGVPTIYVYLLGLSEGVCQEIGRQARLFVSGSAPLPAEVFSEFRQKFGHAILERYGMTETLMITSNPYDGERRPGTVGLPLPGVHVQLLNDSGEAVPDEEVGEIYVNGPNVFPGYWRMPEATRKAFQKGAFATGDLARRSSEGYYTICGRLSDLIISGGFNIYPREVEEFLEQQDGVAEAAVVGRPHPLRGEIPVAYIVPAGNFDPVAIKEACLQNLAAFKVPQDFVMLPELPRNALGKIQKHLLPASDRFPKLN
ncbi:MAG: AMP-binding protein [Terriglobia bacterium]